MRNRSKRTDLLPQPVQNGYLGFVNLQVFDPEVSFVNAHKSKFSKFSKTECLVICYTPTRCRFECIWKLDGCAMRIEDRIKINFHAYKSYFFLYIQISSSFLFSMFLVPQPKKKKKTIAGSDSVNINEPTERLSLTFCKAVYQHPFSPPAAGIEAPLGSIQRRRPSAVGFYPEARPAVTDRHL